MTSVSHAVARYLCAGTVALGLTSATHAQVVRIEVHPFASMTLSDQQILTGRKDGTPVTLAGELRIPRAGSDRLPAIVLMHGSGGPLGALHEWAEQLNPLGIATFIVDSYTGRGLVSTVNDQDQLGRLTMTIDAYRALELLSKHPRVDPSRVAVMGFSRGGQAALGASLKRLQRMHKAQGVDFAAYISFYAGCGTTLVDETDVGDKPIRMFHGTADDYTPIAPCRAYVERLRAKGRDVKLVEYPGAHHVFDWPFLKTPATLAQAQTARGCELAEAPDGRTVNARTGVAFTFAGDPCVERGTTVAYDAAAHAASLKAVKEFVAGEPLRAK